MQRKVTTTITVDRDLYDEIMENSKEFSFNFSKTANHFLRIGLDKVFGDTVKEVLETEKRLKVLGQDLNRI